MGRAPRLFFYVLALASWPLAQAPRALAARDVVVPPQADAAPPGAVDARPEARQLRAEVGVEIDSNPQRSETASGANNVQPTPSPLVRAVVTWSTLSPLGARHQLGLSLSFAGKRFLEPAAQTEDVLLIDEAARLTSRLGSRTLFGLAVSWNEALQRHLSDFRGRPLNAPLPEPRDYRSFSGQARFTLSAANGWTVAAALGGRSFLYKPVPDNSFLAPTGGLQVRFAHEEEDPEGNGAEWELAASLDLEARFFSGLRRVRCAAPDPCVSFEDPSTFQRDDFWQGHFEVTRTGFLLLGLRYTLQLNDSNSYQGSVIRHLASARVATSLPLGFYLAARGELVWANYRDPMNLAWDNAGRPYATFEDENRSNARLELSRTLPAGFDLALRGSHYASAIGGAGNYRRQTLMLVTSWTWN